jgi:hypothetical protein
MLGTAQMLSWHYLNENHKLTIAPSNWLMIAHSIVLLILTHLGNLGHATTIQLLFFYWGTH